MKLEFNSYEELEKFMDDCVWLYCKKCDCKTIYLKRGFKGVNERFECLKCNTESWK